MGHSKWQRKFPGPFRSISKLAAGICHRAFTIYPIPLPIWQGPVQDRKKRRRHDEFCPKCLWAHKFWHNTVGRQILRYSPWVFCLATWEFAFRVFSFCFLRVWQLLAHLSYIKLGAECPTARNDWAFALSRINTQVHTGMQKNREECCIL